MSATVPDRVSSSPTTSTQRDNTKRVEVPALVDEDIKAEIIRASEILGETMQLAIEAGKMLAHAKAETSNKSDQKISKVTWTDYLAMAKLPRQTAEDAIKFAEKFEKCRLAERKEQALLQPSRAKAIAVLDGTKPKSRNRSGTPRPNSTPQPVATDTTDTKRDRDAIDLDALLRVVDLATHHLNSERLQPTKAKAVDLTHALRKLADTIERQQKNAPTTQPASVVKEATHK